MAAGGPGRRGACRGDRDQSRPRVTGSEHTGRALCDRGASD